MANGHTELLLISTEDHHGSTGVLHVIQGKYNQASGRHSRSVFLQDRFAIVLRESPSPLQRDALDSLTALHGLLCRHCTFRMLKVAYAHSLIQPPLVRIQHANLLGA